MSRRSPFPNAAVRFDASEWILYRMTHALTPMQRGELIDRVMMAAMAGDDSILDLPFIAGIEHHASRSGISQAIRKRVLAAGACAACESTERLEVDHVIPVAHGGSNDIGNLQVLCRPCNRAKGPRAYASRKVPA